MGLTQREQGFSSFIFCKKLVISKDLSNWESAEGFIQRIQLAFRFNPFLALNFRSCKILPPISEKSVPSLPNCCSISFWNFVFAPSNKNVNKILMGR